MQRGELEVDYVGTREQVADSLTKFLQSAMQPAARRLLSLYRVSELMNETEAPVRVSMLRVRDVCGKLGECGHKHTSTPVLPLVVSVEGLSVSNGEPVSSERPVTVAVTFPVVDATKLLDIMLEVKGMPPSQAKGTLPSYGVYMGTDKEPFDTFPNEEWTWLPSREETQYPTGEDIMRNSAHGICLVHHRENAGR